MGWACSQRMTGYAEVGVSRATAAQRLVLPNGAVFTKPLGRIVAVPSLWLRPGRVFQQHGLGVSRQLDRLAKVAVEKQTSRFPFRVR